VRHNWKRSGGVWQCARCALVRWHKRVDNGRKYRTFNVYSRDAVTRLNTDDRLVPPCEPASLSSCVLIEWRGRFATIKSRKHNGQPELLGGKAEPGESPEETAVREAGEEGGVEAINLRLVLVASIGGHRCSVFAAEVASGTRLRGGVEGEAVWSTREALLTEGTYRADFPAIVAAYDASKKAK
jgi:8-oxo-dGTP pyrophosphatase MutT (NUDIX family)